MKEIINNLLGIPFSESFFTVLILGFIGWLMRNWIWERLSSSIKHEYDVNLENLKSNLATTHGIELERFKAKIGTEYDIIKDGLLRYSEKQFDLYNDLWAQLCELEICVNNLWEKASTTNLLKLAKQIPEVRNRIRKSALLIEGRHYQELSYILDEFESYQFGKQRLIDLRNMDPDEHFYAGDIQNTISQNAEHKNRLAQSLSSIMDCLKRQILKSE